MEENIKTHMGAPVRVVMADSGGGADVGCSGEVVGPYAKMGKCKVFFPGGLRMEHVGAEVEILLALP